mmetsp:Transcript_71294/g.202177  ORF Transcript_71294/g.202177 Transcript_71294/m.202177 type:complete len:559 (-) Transcript_71294:574-2250(-)
MVADEKILLGLLTVLLLPALLGVVVLEAFAAKAAPSPPLLRLARVHLRLVLLGQPPQLLRHRLVALPQCINHVLSPVALVWLDERVRKTWFARPASAPDAVDVVFQVIRDLEIDDQDDRPHVDAPRSNGGCNQDVGDLVLEVLQREVPITLVLAPMESKGWVAILEQLREHLVDVLLLVDEYDNGAVLVPLTQQLQEPVELLALLKHLHKLRHVCGRCVPLPDRDLERLLEDLPRESLHVRGKRRAEHGHLLVWARALEEHAYLRFKAHVKHPVGLVQDQKADAPEVRDLPVGGREHADEPARRADQDVGALLQGRQLLAHRPAAEGADADEADGLAKDGGLALDLQRELPRRRHREDDGPVAVRQGRLVQDVADCGKEVRQRLPGARLRHADDVPPAHHGRNSLHLDGERHVVLALLQDLLDLRRQPALEEAPDGPGAVLPAYRDLALGAPQIVNLMFLHAGDLLHLDVKILPEGSVLDLGVVHMGKGLLRGEPLHEVEVGLLGLLLRLLAPVRVAVHALLLLIAEGLPRLLLRGFLLGLRFCLLLFSPHPPLLLLC